MKKNLIILTAVLSLATCNVFSQKGTLTFDVSGISENTGQSQQDDVPSSPYMKVKAGIKHNKVVVVIEKLSYGEYAAIILHDKNSNGETDHSWGIPSEPLGFTNNWELSLFSGMPSFEKLKFTFSSTNNLIKIDMKE
ncbi:MAG: DUF2141 domain-containing protein [Bacteroidota bacterium]